MGVITTCKLILAMLIALTINDWWLLGPLDTSLVQSCSSSKSTSCESYCNDNSIVHVNITDDDYTVDVYTFPSDVEFNQHYNVYSYCIAELPGHCAYDYWLIFKLVPLLLHIMSFCLQILFWVLFRDFSPQRKQFDTTIRCLYPHIPRSSSGGSGSKPSTTNTDADTDADTNTNTAALVTYRGYISMRMSMCIWWRRYQPLCATPYSHSLKCSLCYTYGVSFAIHLSIVVM